jgi:hypothetical protein
MKTIITHFYNEEYLLPWWLHHHKKYFDHGILIDYDSTDRSVEICKEICPTWQVVKSFNKEFGAWQIDHEVMSYERQFEGWRIALNVTEFLLGNFNELMHDRKERTQYLIPSISFFDWNPQGTLNQDKPLWEQKYHGIDYKTDFMTRRARSLHNFNDIQYDAGRHYSNYTCDTAIIFHYANCISSPEMLARRLQIQTRIPKADVMRNMGHQHHNYGKGLTEESLKSMLDHEKHKISNQFDLISFYTK